MSATASQAFLWASDHNLPHLIRCSSLFSLLLLPSTLRCCKSEVNLLHWWIWQSSHSSVEAGHTGPGLDSCDQWLAIIILIPWPLFDPEVCLSACTTQDAFHAMRPNPFLILCVTLQFLSFLKSAHHCLILCCCTHPGSELRDVADCSHLISLLLCSLQPLQLPGASPVLQQQ